MWAFSTHWRYRPLVFKSITRSKVFLGIIRVSYFRGCTQNYVETLASMSIKELWFFFHLPAPNGTLDDAGLFLSLASFLSSLLLPITVIWFPIDVVLTTFGLGVVRVQVVVPGVWVFRKSKIDGDLSIRLRVCNNIGPSFVPFLFNRCWRIIDPSGMVAVVAVEATEVNVVADAFDVVIVFKACDECNRVPLMPFPPSALVSMIWLAFFNADWITNLLDSVDRHCLDIGATVVASDVFLCKRIDGAFDVLHVILSSSPPPLMLTAPLFNKLNKSCPFCRIIWPFSVRAPRINIILLGWCCCCFNERIINGNNKRMTFFLLWKIIRETLLN